MMAYLAMMAPRLVELRRVLKPSGAIYLHCDPTASHYLKILMDAVFGSGMFRNEIVWQRTGAHGSSKRFGPVHDTILFYTKTDAYVWNAAYMPLPQETADAWFNNIEPDTGRRFNRNTLTAPGVRSGSSGKPWRGIDPTAKGRHWAVPGFARDVIGDLDTIEALEALDKIGRVFWPKKSGGTPMLKLYLDESKGVPALDVWIDIRLQTSANERLGYPTQKPQSLLERIINASSNEGDTVLDPFCGCGTTIAAAHKRKRKWIGIDIAQAAVQVIKKRFRDHFGIDLPAEVIGEPESVADAQVLANTQPYQFQWWALGLVDARPTEGKKGADKGIDGRRYFVDPTTGQAEQIIFSVKAGHVTVGHLRDLRGVIEREKALMGALICMEEPTRPMRAEAADAGFVETVWGKYPRLQIRSIEELLSGQSLKAPNPIDATYKRAPRVASPAADQPTLYGIERKPAKASVRPRGRWVKKKRA